MSRKKHIEEKLKTAGIEVGDIIKITRKDDENEGVLMPHHQFSTDDIVNIKLKSGYNAAIALVLLWKRKRD